MHKRELRNKRRVNEEEKKEKKEEEGDLESPTVMVVRGKDATRGAYMQDAGQHPSPEKGDG